MKLIYFDLNPGKLIFFYHILSTLALVDHKFLASFISKLNLSCTEVNWKSQKTIMIKLIYCFRLYACLVKKIRAKNAEHT